MDGNPTVAGRIETSDIKDKLLSSVSNDVTQNGPAERIIVEKKDSFPERSVSQVSINDNVIRCGGSEASSFVYNIWRDGMRSESMAIRDTLKYNNDFIDAGERYRGSLTSNETASLLDKIQMGQGNVGPAFGGAVAGGFGQIRSFNSSQWTVRTVDDESLDLDAVYDPNSDFNMDPDDSRSALGNADMYDPSPGQINGGPVSWKDKYGYPGNHIAPPTNKTESQSNASLVHLPFKSVLTNYTTMTDPERRSIGSGVEMFDAQSWDNPIKRHLANIMSENKSDGSKQITFPQNRGSLSSQTSETKTPSEVLPERRRSSMLETMLAARQQVDDARLNNLCTDLDVVVNRLKTPIVKQAISDLRARLSKLVQERPVFPPKEVTDSKESKLLGVHRTSKTTDISARLTNQVSSMRDETSWLGHTIDQIPRKSQNSEYIDYHDAIESPDLLKNHEYVRMQTGIFQDIVRLAIDEPFDQLRESKKNALVQELKIAAKHPAFFRPSRTTTNTYLPARDLFQTNVDEDQDAKKRDWQSGKRYTEPSDKESPQFEETGIPKIVTPRENSCQSFDTARLTLPSMSSFMRPTDSSSQKGSRLHALASAKLIQAMQANEILTNILDEPLLYYDTPCDFDENDNNNNIPSTPSITTTLQEPRNGSSGIINTVYYNKPQGSSAHGNIANILSNDIKDNKVDNNNRILRPAQLEDGGSMESERSTNPSCIASPLTRNDETERYHSDVVVQESKRGGNEELVQLQTNDMSFSTPNFGSVPSIQSDILPQIETRVDESPTSIKDPGVSESVTVLSSEGWTPSHSVGTPGFRTKPSFTSKDIQSLVESSNHHSSQRKPEIYQKIKNNDVQDTYLTEQEQAHIALHDLFTNDSDSKSKNTLEASFDVLPPHQSQRGSTLEKSDFTVERPVDVHERNETEPSGHRNLGDANTTRMSLDIKNRSTSPKDRSSDKAKRFLNKKMRDLSVASVPQKPFHFGKVRSSDARSISPPSSYIHKKLGSYTRSLGSLSPRNDDSPRTITRTINSSYSTRNSPRNQNPPSSRGDIRSGIDNKIPNMNIEQKNSSNSVTFYFGEQSDNQNTRLKTQKNPQGTSSRK